MFTYHNPEICTDKPPMDKTTRMVSDAPTYAELVAIAEACADECRRLEQEAKSNQKRLNFYRAENQKLTAEIGHLEMRVQQWKVQAELMTKKCLEAKRLLEQSERMVKNDIN